MTPFILIPIIIAYCKGYRAHRVFAVCDLYPLLFTVLCHGVFVAFAGALLLGFTPEEAAAIGMSYENLCEKIIEESLKARKAGK